MNERDSEQVAQMFVERGFTMTPKADGADVILMNTCSVRDQAEQKALGKYGPNGKASAQASQYRLWPDGLHGAEPW